MKQLGQYQIEERLGEGSFAEVYRAIDTHLDRPVALKLLKANLLNDEQALRRFIREAKVMARLSHPHIVSLFGIGDSGGRIYLVQQLVEGMSLAERLKQGPLTWTEALAILEPIAAALDYAHQHQLIHRDLKPSNILLDRQGYAYLSDFGLVHAAAEESTRLSTSLGGVVGTPAYMAPEVWDDEPVVTGAADVYALCCVVCEMLTGRVLFDGSKITAVIRQHTEGPRLPEQWPDGAPSGLNGVLRQGLAPEPAARIGRAGKLLQALAGLSGARQQFSVPTLLLPKKTSQPRSGSTTQTDRFAIEQPFEMTFIRIPAGPFLMGSDPARDQSTWGVEQPQRRVTLDEYYLARYPVTNAQYAAFLQATNYKPLHQQALEAWFEKEKGWFSTKVTGIKIPVGGENHPATYISWNDAVAFCRWLSKASGYAIRLPTEAEWEKAARGTDGRLYPWGNDWDSTKCNVTGKGTTPVGRYSPQGDSPYGLADMAGNVWEWVAGWYEADYYGKSPVANPTGPLSGNYRVVRGGGWNSLGNLVQAADRGWCVPTVTYFNFGFRCARSP